MNLIPYIPDIYSAGLSLPAAWSYLAFRTHYRIVVEEIANGTVCVYFQRKYLDRKLGWMLPERAWPKEKAAAYANAKHWLKIGSVQVSDADADEKLLELVLEAKDIEAQWKQKVSPEAKPLVEAGRKALKR